MISKIYINPFFFFSEIQMMEDFCKILEISQFWIINVVRSTLLVWRIATILVFYYTTQRYLYGCFIWNFYPDSVGLKNAGRVFFNLLAWIFLTMFFFNFQESKCWALRLSAMCIRVCSLHVRCKTVIKVKINQQNNPLLEFLLR